MLRLSELFFALLAIAHVATAATYTVTLATSYASSTVCYTISSTKSPASVKTVSTSKTLPPDYVISSTTSTPFVTVTPSPSTATSTSIVFTTSTTTLSTSVATFTSTESFSTTTTTVTTVTSTETDVSTVNSTVTSTSVVASPTGFLTISNTTNLMNAMQAQKREIVDVSSAAVANTHGLSKGTNKTLYEYEVQCVDRIQPWYTIEVIKVHSTVKTTLAPSTITTTSISTSTVTSSTVLTASTTTTLSVTSTSTETDTSTTTTTTSSTTTNTATVVTSSYAACATNNLLGPALSNGYYTDQDDPYGIASEQASAGTDPYDCCALCVNTAGCSYGVLYYSTGAILCNLYFQSNDACPSGQPHVGGLEVSAASNSFNDTWFNGLCGSMQYYGTE